MCVSSFTSLHSQILQTAASTLESIQLTQIAQEAVALSYPVIDSLVTVADTKRGREHLSIGYREYIYVPQSEDVIR